MIDWITALLPCAHERIPRGRVTITTPHGELEQEYPRANRALGSHDSSIRIQSSGDDGQGGATHLFIDGNPSKFLQGHNVFGSDDLMSLVYDTFLYICKTQSILPNDIDTARVKAGDYDISRIDINYSFELPTREDVRSMIRALEYRSKTRHGRPNLSKGTLYWGKSSRRWALKAYSKGDELEGGKDHALPLALEQTQIKEWADNKFRLELVLRSLELREKGLEKACSWNKEVIGQVYREYLRRLEMSEQIRLRDSVEDKLPTFVRSTYRNWLHGEDCVDILTKTTFYRHRKILIDYGVDISKVKPSNHQDNNVIPIIRVLEASPAAIPTWAFAHDLIHHSARRAVA